MEKKHDLKTQENVIQVCGNELSCGNIPNTDAYQGLCPGCLGEQPNRRGSDLKEVAGPLLIVNAYSEMTTKSPQLLRSECHLLFFSQVHCDIMLFGYANKNGVSLVLCNAAYLEELGYQTGDLVPIRTNCC